jgi:hypothetical protein
MLRRMSIVVCLAGVVAILISAPAAQATYIPIDVQNASFETPDASGSPYYASLPGQGNWPPVMGGGWRWNGMGAYAINKNILNSMTIDIPSNLDGNQFCQLNYDPGSVGVSLVQDLAAIYEVGKRYRLTVGVAKRSDQAGQPTDQLDLRMAWRSGTESVDVLNTTVVTKGDVSTSALTYYNVDVPVIQAGDIAVGKTIEFGIVTTTMSGSGGAVWTIDNVSLASEYVPEPSSIVLTASAVLGLLAYAWRKRR